jgi:glutamate/aspartate transport system substrate-binding protein
MPLLLKTLFRTIASVTVIFCTTQALAVGPGNQPATVPSTLERIRDTGRIRIGYGDTAPFSYRLPNGQVVGYSIDLCKQVSEKLRAQLGLPRLETEYVYRTPRNRIQLLNDGKIDIECNASTNSSERRRSAAFALSHFYASTRYVSLTRHGLQTLDDLRGRSLSVALGTVNVGQISELNRDRALNLSIVPADGLQAAFDLVAGGQVSAFAMDDVLLSAMIAASSKPQDFALSGELVSASKPYGFMMRLGDDAFKEAVNAALTQIYRDPTMADIYRRWFEEPIPPHGVNLRQPMSLRLQQALAQPREEAGL